MSSGEEDEDLLLLVLLNIIQEQIDVVAENIESLLLKHIKEQRRLNRSLPENKRRPTWDAFCSKISDVHFRRMFRMKKSAFVRLCNKICKRIGEEKFFPECKKEELAGRNRSIVGEIKTAIGI